MSVVKDSISLSRIGQRRDVRVYRLITAGSIEENVYLRQVYKQQMSKNAVDGEKATRYFNAVLRHRKGELFGINNMFAVRDGKSCLTDGILKRKEAVEQVTDITTFDVDIKPKIMWT